MSTDGTLPVQACTDPTHTGARRVALGCNGPDPAEADAPGQFARAFRLIQRNGTAVDGVEFTNHRVIVMDDPDWGLCSGARSLELLLRSGYHGARVEWPDEQLHTRLTALLATWRATGPPVGTSVSRWWDARLAELDAALAPGREADRG